MSNSPRILEKQLYTASATAIGGRAGSVKSDDGTIDFPLALPTGLGGAGGAGTNPEQLFAAGYSACFAGALGLVARLQGVNPGPHTITAQVAITRGAKRCAILYRPSPAMPTLCELGPT